jgi:hypothetical protein
MGDYSNGFAVRWRAIATEPMRWHAITNTSRKRGEFRGYCVLCGQHGLTLNDHNKECPNPRRLTRAQGMMET